MTAQRFLPEFTCDELKAAVQPPLRAEVDAQRASLFDAALEPLMTAKSPQGGRDILPSSANHFYSGASMADLKGFTEKYPLNSLLVKDKSGTPDGKTPAGMYAGYLKKANEYLERDYAEAGQAAAIAALIRYGYVKQQLGYSAMYGVK
jgi:dipeptidyl-peptidase-3